jgi:pyruvate,water dikinase
MQKRIQQAAEAARQREAVRSEATRGITVLRAFALRAGELLGLGEDVFFLTIDEVLQALQSEAAIPAVQHIAARKETFQRYRALPPYPALICGRFDPFVWAADPNRRSDVFDAHSQAATSTTAADQDDHTLHGFAGALGVVEGVVRRLDSMDDSEAFQPGEVLVTTMTNIGWTPLFPRAAAIITDLGAPLSHAAIVARELGIPAVVGCGNATMRLKTGDRVRVDGGKGLVQIL